MDQGLKRRLDEGIVLHRSGELRAAKSVLMELAKEFSGEAEVVTAHAHVLWDLGELDAATEQFRVAVSLWPNVEAVSLGLFHCLWELGLTDDAFDEMKRFVSICPSEEYAKLVKIINQN